MKAILRPDASAASFIPIKLRVCRGGVGVGWGGGYVWWCICVWGGMCGGVCVRGGGGEGKCMFVYERECCAQPPV